MQSPRVADAWKQSGPIEEHREYLRGLQNDAHVVPVFGSFNGVNAMYAELYWVAVCLFGLLNCTWSAIPGVLLKLLSCRRTIWRLMCQT